MSNQYGFFVDTSRCIKCWACVIACKQWNGIKAGGVSRRKVDETIEGTFPDVNRIFTSHACNHCENPACVESCPAGAITKREEDGIVVFDREKCIGCQTCASVCPWGVPEYDVEDGKMNKCDGCTTCGRTEEGLTHCAATCPTQALHFGPLDEMEALAAEKGGARMEGETGPCVFIA
ncbi:MAG: 4Fe-4S dicluster domain-containing protein [Coriobacteriia bacterium]|nr:4Fe-4S dicluster domain-containing protein [Coriobacteriia bacterium]MBS5478683.1 4Fe-4S dicluster domain-containing protein [Coriobacteriia bacterium]